jgi:hypothetical protein
LNNAETVKQLFNDYEKYRETNLESDFIKHVQIINLLKKLEAKNIFKINLLGKSVEGREIFSVTIGTGKTKILAWSQMHGDEPTATAALFDLFNFFIAQDSLDDFRKKLLDKITFHFIPMLNPDGAEKFKRGNAFNMDLNRDTLRLESSESNILWNYAYNVKPDFGFNLHDQNSYYTAGRSNNPSAISLLAPPMNHVKSINYIREQSMQVICKIQEALSSFIPNNIARYSDDHEPRSFGDNFMKKEISSILIESGYYKNDAKKDFVRKLNFISLLAAFNSIAENDFKKIDHNKYFDIPENQQMLFDLLLRNLALNYNGNSFKIDIGINREKCLDTLTNTFYFKSKVAELGDLSIYYGLEEHNLNGYEVRTEKLLAVDDEANLKLYKNEKFAIEILNGFMTNLKIQL